MELWVTDSRFDRALDARMDPTWVADTWAGGGARVLGVNQRSEITVDEDGGALRWTLAAGEYDPTLHFLVGATADAAWFVRFDTGPDGASGPTASLRDLALIFDDTHTDLVASAVALINWHRVAPHCGVCGAMTVVQEGGHARWCEACRRQRFPRTDPAVIVAVLDADDRLLLAHQVVWEAGRVSILAGFVEAGESLEQAVHREILEECGIEVTDITYLGSQPWPFPRSLMLGYVARAVTTEITVDGTEIEYAHFYTRPEFEDAVAASRLILPGGASIGSRLIHAWRSGDLRAWLAL